jgi:aspartyl/asparaginyl beta-hydroxylase (cupin superfamily)
MDIFENCMSKKNYNKFKLLEDNYEKILCEIPHFDINKVSIYRKQNEWNNEKGGQLAEKLHINKEWIGTWDFSKKWFNFPLIYYDNIIGFAESLCPTTISILKKIGGINIAGFSLLLPNTSLQPHTDSTGPTYNSMALNMHLIGEKSSLYVKNNGSYHNYTHKNGSIVIFNPENQHYADNMSCINRIILYIDFAL